MSWQLENEALLKSFGTNGNFNRERLKEEFALVKALDTRPVIMTTSDAFGLPIHKPVPDMYAYSIYRYTYKRDKYIYQVRPALAYYMRSLVIRLVHNRRSFIHELQCEPWGPKGNGQMTLEECFKSMSFERFKDAVAHAQKTRLSPIDLWGLEWWWWLKTSHNDDRFWNYARDHIFNTPS